MKRDRAVRAKSDDGHPIPDSVESEDFIVDLPTDVWALVFDQFKTTPGSWSATLRQNMTDFVSLMGVNKATHASGKQEFVKQMGHLCAVDFAAPPAVNTEMQSVARKWHLPPLTVTNNHPRRRTKPLVSFPHPITITLKNINQSHGTRRAYNRLSRNSKHTKALYDSTMAEFAKIVQAIIRPPKKAEAVILVVAGRNLPGLLKATMMNSVTWLLKEAQALQIPVDLDVDVTIINPQPLESGRHLINALGQIQSSTLRVRRWFGHFTLEALQAVAGNDEPAAASTATIVPLARHVKTLELCLLTLTNLDAMVGIPHIRIDFCDLRTSLVPLGQAAASVKIDACTFFGRHMVDFTALSMVPMISLCKLSATSLPPLTHVRILKLELCDKLETLPHCPRATFVQLRHLPLIKAVDPLTAVEELVVICCPWVTDLRALGSSLRRLHVDQANRPIDCHGLTRVRALRLSSCGDIGNLEGLERVVHASIHNYDGLTSISGLHDVQVIQSEGNRLKTELETVGLFGASAREIWNGVAWFESTWPGGAHRDPLLVCGFPNNHHQPFGQSRADFLKIYESEIRNRPLIPPPCSDPTCSNTSHLFTRGNASNRKIVLRAFARCFRDIRVGNFQIPTFMKTLTDTITRVVISQELMRYGHRKPFRSEYAPTGRTTATMIDDLLFDTIVASLKSPVWPTSSSLNDTCRFWYRSIGADWRAARKRTDLRQSVLADRRTAEVGNLQTLQDVVAAGKEVANNKDVLRQIKASVDQLVAIDQEIVLVWREAQTVTTTPIPQPDISVTSETRLSHINYFLTLVGLVFARQTDELYENFKRRVDRAVASVSRAEAIRINGLVDQLRQISIDKGLGLDHAIHSFQPSCPRACQTLGQRLQEILGAWVSSRDPEFAAWVCPVYELRCRLRGIW